MFGIAKMQVKIIKISITNLDEFMAIRIHLCAETSNKNNLIMTRNIFASGMAQE